EPGFQLGIAVTRSSPVGVPSPAVEGWRQLSCRPVRVVFPQAAQGVADGMRKIDRPEMFDVALIQTQKLPARGKIVVDNVERFAVHSRSQAGERDRVS